MNKRKFCTVFVLLALCAAVLCGCAGGKRPLEESGGGPQSTPELENPSVSVDGPVYTGEEIKGSPYVGRFVNSYSAQFASDANAVYVRITEGEDGEIETEPLDLPVLECRADGTFSLTVATAVGGEYATVNGNFTVNGEYAEFTVAQGYYGDFLGSDTEKFTCRLLNGDELRYWGDQIGTVVGGDIFRRAD